MIDVENLRRHYALTLDAWAERFDANWEKIHALDPVRFDERFRRIWRTYLWAARRCSARRTATRTCSRSLVSKGNIDATTIR